MFRMNGMTRAQEAQERLLSNWHSVREVATESPWTGSRCVLNQDTTPPWRSTDLVFMPQGYFILTSP